MIEIAVSLGRRFLVTVWTVLFFLLLSMLSEVILSQSFLPLSELFKGDQEEKSYYWKTIFSLDIAGE